MHLRSLILFVGILHCFLMQSSNPQPAPEVEQEAPPHTRELSVEEESMGDIDYHIPICPLPEPPAGNSGSAEETK